MKKEARGVPVTLLVYRNMSIHMQFRFIDREEELEFLERKYSEDGFQFIIIYGRRRVGKTELIKQFIKKKDAIYLLADKLPFELQLRNFSRHLSAYFEKILFEFPSFETMCDYITKKCKEWFIVVID